MLYLACQGDVKKQSKMQKLLVDTNLRKEIPMSCSWYLQQDKNWPTYHCLVKQFFGNQIALGSGILALHIHACKVENAQSDCSASDKKV